MKIILNFQNGKKALPNIFLKTFVNFFVQWSLHVQNSVWIRVQQPIFAAALWCSREYLRGGGEFEEPAFLNSLHAHIRSGKKKSSCYWPTAVGRGSLDRRQRSKKPNFVWLFGPHAAQWAFHKLLHGKGLKGPWHAPTRLQQRKKAICPMGLNIGMQNTIDFCENNMLWKVFFMALGCTQILQVKGVKSYP